MPLFLRTNWSAVAVSLAIVVPLGCGSESGTTPAAMGGTTSAAGNSGSGGTQASGGTGGSGGVSLGGAGVGGATAGTAATGGSGGIAGGAGGAGGASGGAGGGGAGGVAGSSGGGAGGSSGDGGAGGAGGAAPFELLSPAFTHVEECSDENHAPCEEWPNANLLDTIGGDNMSPELNWGPGPEGTMSYALVLHDYTNGFTHWAVWNLSVGTLTLPANMITLPQGASQVSFEDGDGYAGPGANDHVYEFRLYALNVATFTPGNATDQGAIRGELENDPDGIVLGSTDLRGVTPPP